MGEQMREPTLAFLSSSELLGSSMGRPKSFSRADVLDRAIPVFWKQGFADTKIEHLEEATRVNKSGLYTEFRSKDEIFVESLKRYLQLQSDASSLLQPPLGWESIERFFERCVSREERGCFLVNTMREVDIIPAAAQKMLTTFRTTLKRLIQKNLEVEGVEKPDIVAAVIFTFFVGLSIQDNLGKRKSVVRDQLDVLLQSLRRV
jgi:AcrR family transcriptional regulator